MIELILYNLSTSGVFIATFLILLFIIGVMIFILTKKFKPQNGKIKIYGLLLSLRNIDIVRISAIVVRTFVIIYSLLVFNKNVEMYLIMIAIISGIFIITYLRNIIYEVLNTGALMALVYFSDQLSQYLINVENSKSIQLLRLILVCFGVIYTVYIFFREFEDITTEHDNIIE